MLDDAQLLLRSYASRQAYDAIAYRDFHVVRVERHLFLETIPNERAQLTIGLLVDLVDVLVIPFHRSSESAVRAVQVTERTGVMRRA